VKQAVCVLALSVIGIGGAFGCDKNKKTSAIPRSESVVDVNVPPAPAQAYQPPAPQPVVTDTMTSQSPAAIPAAAGSIAPGTYTIRKGDTLYSLAQKRWGDGKQWTRIASANPGLRPETLKVGQTIVIP